jgi:hypothetical protein
VAVIGDTVELAVWVEAGATPTYAWSAAAGKIRPGVRGKATWDLTGVETGPAQAEVEVRRKGAMPATCTVEVRVVGKMSEGTRGTGERTSGRTLLDSNQNETDGFGLYSYILFGSQPEDADKERYKQIVAACLKLIPSALELQKYLPPNRLNAVFLPVKESAPANADAAWVLDHYDYARARALLTRAPVSNKSGVYIVSASAPLLGKANSGKYLVQDLSKVPANLASSWVDAFINQAAQEKYWEASTATQLVLKMRLALSTLAVGVPQIKQAVAAWISIKG